MPYALDLLDSASPACPYRDGSIRCRAAASGLIPDRRRIRLNCSSDNYDCCPLYLARLLRSSRSTYCGASRHDLFQK